MHMYYGYHFFGMHAVWWFIWIAFLVTIFGWYPPVRRTREQGKHQH